MSEINPYSGESLADEPGGSKTLANETVANESITDETTASETTANETTAKETIAKERLGARCYLLLVGFLIILTILWIGRPEIVTRGEGREALVARSLFEQREYILPRGYGGVVPSKPPALHWFIGACSSLFGEVNEFACRLPSALTSLLLILFLASWVARRDTKRVWPTVIVLATSFEWLRASVSCRVDMLHAAALAGAVILGSGISANLSSTRVRWLAVVALSLISTLTKGPVGALLPAAILFIFGYWEHRRLFLSAISAGSIALGAINLAAVWYLAAYLQGGAEFIDKISYENLQRFMSTMDDAPHRHSVWYLLGMGILGFMPWSLPFLWQLAVFIFGRGATVGVVDQAKINSSRDNSKLQTAHSRGWFRKKAEFIHNESLKCWNGIITEPESRLSIVAILVLFTFYAIPSGKRGVYLLAAYPFGAILLGRFICDSHKIRVKVAAAMTKFLQVLVAGLAIGIFSLSISYRFNFYPVLNQISAVERLVNHGSSSNTEKVVFSGMLSNIGLMDLGLLALAVVVLVFGCKLFNRGLHDTSSHYSHGRQVFKKLALAYTCLLVMAQAVIFPAATNSLGISATAKRIDENTVGGSFNQADSVNFTAPNFTAPNFTAPNLTAQNFSAPVIYSYGSELYSVAFYSHSQFKSITPLVEAPGFSGFRDGTWVALESRYLNKLQSRLAALKYQFNSDPLAAPDGCFDIVEIKEFKEQENLVKGRMALVKISCKST